MHPTVADVASPFLPSIRHAKSAPPCKAKTLANAQVFRASTAEIYPLNSTKTLFWYIPRSRHDPKILWVDDAEIVGDRITKVRPIPRDLFTQKTERRIGELGTSCVALVVSDVSVHEAP